MKAATSELTFARRGRLRPGVKVLRAQPCVECGRSTFCLWRLLPLCTWCFIAHVLPHDEQGGEGGGG